MRRFSLFLALVGGVVWLFVYTQTESIRLETLRLRRSLEAIEEENRRLEKEIARLTCLEHISLQAKRLGLVPLNKYLILPPSWMAAARYGEGEE